MTKIGKCAWVLFESGLDVGFHVLANAALKMPIRSAEAAIYGTFHALSNGVLQGIMGHCCCSKKEEEWGDDCYGMREACDLMEKSAKKVAKTFFAFFPAAVISWGITQTIVENSFSFPEALALSGTSLGLTAGGVVSGGVIIGTLLYMGSLWNERRDEWQREKERKQYLRKREELPPLQQRMVQEREEGEPSPRHLEIDIEEEGMPNTAAPRAPTLSVP